MQQVKVIFLDDACRFEKLEVGDWIDLRARKSLRLFEGQRLDIPLGVRMELPVGYEAWILPRSSTFDTWGIEMSNSMGIIDNSYRGEWHFSAIAHRFTKVNKGDRICQFRIALSQPRLLVTEVDRLSPSARGDNGFGSTGVA